MKYYSANLRLENQKLGKGISSQFHTENQAFKSYNDLGNDVKDKVNEIINANPLMKEKLGKDYKNNPELVYNEYRNEIFEVYKDNKLNEGLSDKIGKLKGEKPADAELIDRARKLMQPATSNTKRVSLTRGFGKTTDDGTNSRTTYCLS